MIIDQNLDDSAGCQLSDDHRYRYRLWREWRPSVQPLTAILLNPSTADHATDDPTLRKLIGYARRAGCGGLDLVNLFALRSTDPQQLTQVADPVGPDNHRIVADHLTLVSRHDWPILVGWGTTLAGWDPRDAEVDWLVGTLAEIRGRGLLCCGTTADGSPRHPSRGAYVPLVPWAPA